MKHFSFACAGLLAAFFLLSACDETPETGTTPEEPAKPVIPKNETFEQRSKREIEAMLKIPANEKYTYTIYHEKINYDSVPDAIITINRMEYAMDEAIKKDRTAKAEEVGYMGNYNYFVYYDGLLGTYSPPIPVPSSPGRPLDISFETMTSPNRKDIIVDYRVRNSGWRSYFAVLNSTDVLLVFQWKRFDGIGKDAPEGILHQLEERPGELAKDIVIYESAVDNNKPGMSFKDSYAFIPEITQKGKLTMRFFYDPAYAKYRAYSQSMLNKLR